MMTNYDPAADGPQKIDLDTDDPKEPEAKGFHIQIDRAHYEVLEEKLTGAELRHVPPTPIPSERDLFQIIPGHSDLKIKDDDTVQMHDGLRFFTAPSTINPGVSSGSHGTTEHVP